MGKFWHKKDHEYEVKMNFMWSTKADGEKMLIPLLILIAASVVYSLIYDLKSRHFHITTQNTEATN